MGAPGAEGFETSVSGTVGSIRATVRASWEAPLLVRLQPVAWASLVITAGPAAAGALDSWSTAPRAVATVILWAVWAAVLLASFAPRPLGLTALRVAAPVALVLAAMTGLAVVDVITDSRVVPIVLLVLGPLAAAIRFSPAITAGVGAYAFALAVALGELEGSFLSSWRVVALLAVGGAAVLATVIASVRARLEALQARTAGLLARARFLADAGAVLDRSLNPDETLRQIASLAVPERAAMCVIDLIEDDGGIRGVAVEARDDELAEGMREMRERFPLDPDGPHPVAQVLREERSTLIQLDDPTLSGLAASGEHLDFMRRAHYRSAMVVPSVHLNSKPSSLTSSTSDPGRRSASRAGTTHARSSSSTGTGKPR